MSWSVYQHWDPLKVCMVGRSYPPEFYSWITKPKVRGLFEKIAIETEEDYQHIINKLQQFGVEILRPDLPNEVFIQGKYEPPPMTPRDHMVMIGNRFYENVSVKFHEFYKDVKDPTWPDCQTLAEFDSLSQHIKDECLTVHNFDFYINKQPYSKILNTVAKQGNQIRSHISPLINGAMVSRLGKDLYFSTHDYNQDQRSQLDFVNQEFTNTRNHIINTGGHGDATYCPVTPGLIISLFDVPTYAETFPGWEVVYLPGQSWTAVKDFIVLKKKNKGRWWIPGFEHDQDVIDVVETWLNHWTGFVEETVFDVNMLIIDPKNVMVFNYNKTVFDAFKRHGITPHIVPFRHRYFWDGGIHCVTCDLHREGIIQDYFPNRHHV